MTDDPRRQFATLWEQLEATLIGRSTLDVVRPRPAPEPLGGQTVATERALPRIELAPEETPHGSTDPGDFALRGVLGVGGMGKVFLATQRSLGRPVAVKVLHEESSASAQNALLREARTAGGLEHPNIVPVHQLGVDDRGRPVLVMKRVEGVSWKTLLHEKNHASWASLAVRHTEPLVTHLEVLTQVCNALQFAHAQRVLHRDVKPENVMIGEFGEVYLLDWGISLRLDAEHTNDDTSLTGTPAYMAPEMVAGRRNELDARTDVYLLGATLHEVLTGKPRHEGKTMAMVLLAAYLSEPYAYGPEVPRELAALCNAATAKDPAQRPASVAAFRRVLADYLEHRASVALGDSAQKSLDALRAQEGVAQGSPAALASPAAWRRMTESRFGFLQALRGWPDYEAARAGLQAVLGFMLERELALKNAAAARSLLAELPEPRADMEARVATLEGELGEAKKLEASERDRQREMDLSGSSRVRGVAFFVQASVVIAVGVAFTARASVDRRPPPLKHLLLAEALLFAIAAGIMVAFRRRMRTNLIGRRVGNLILLAIAAGGFVDALRLDRVVSTPVGSAAKLLAVASVLAGGALLGLPGLGLAAAVLGAGLVALAVYPDQFVVITPATIAGSALVIAWAAAAGRLRARPLT